jgi:hypothetical protein
MARRTLCLALVGAALAGCGGHQVTKLVLPGTAVDMGLSPKGLAGATYSMIPSDDGFAVLTVEEESMVLISYDGSGQRVGSETMLNLQPELWQVTPELIASARMTPRYEDLPAQVLEACLREGMSEMARHVNVYDRGLVRAGQGYGVIFGARTTLECEEAGHDAMVGLEHVIVFDETMNRVQQDVSLWIETIPLDAIAHVEGREVHAVWLARDGVYVGGAGAAPDRAVKFTDPWNPSDPPVHFLVPTPGGPSMFALGVVERPMATVGQGESYLVMHVAGASDPHELEVSRLPLPYHPQAAAAAWSGSALGVFLFSEVRMPHKESFAHVHFVEYDAKARPSGELASIMDWSSATGKTFGMLELRAAWSSGTYGAAILYEQDMMWMIDLIRVTGGAAATPAMHDMGWREAKDMRMQPHGGGFGITWSDKVIRFLAVDVR